MRPELSQSAAESNGESGARSVGTTHSGVNTDMVFTLPGQNVMPSTGSAPQGSEPQALQPESIHPRLSLQYFEPEGFLEVM